MGNVAGRARTITKGGSMIGLRHIFLATLLVSVAALAALPARAAPTEVMASVIETAVSEVKTAEVPAHGV